jgi:transposase
VLTGILFVLRSGLPWRMLPQEMGCGSGVTCWRRLRAWQQRGVWKRLHRVMLAELAATDHIDWERAALDARALSAKKGEPRPGATRPIGAARARSTTSLSTRRASRSPVS